MRLLKQRDEQDEHGERIEVLGGVGAVGTILARDEGQGLFRISAHKCDPIAERATALRLSQLRGRMRVC